MSSTVRQRWVLWVPALLAVVLLGGGCAHRRSQESTGFRPPGPDAQAKWREQNGVTAASTEDCAAAEKCRAWFHKQRATAPDGKLQVAFHAGTYVGSNTLHRGLSTTSTYVLRDARGRQLANAPSRSVEAITQQDQDKRRRSIWFAPRGDRVVIYESSGENEGPLTIILSSRPDSEGGWDVRCVRLPWGAGHFTEDEGSRPVCMGILGDEILVNPDIGDGRIYRKNLRELEDVYPFPFFLG